MFRHFLLRDQDEPLTAKCSGFFLVLILYSLPLIPVALSSPSYVSWFALDLSTGSFLFTFLAQFFKISVTVFFFSFLPALSCPSAFLVNDSLSWTSSLSSLSIPDLHSHCQLHLSVISRDSNAPCLKYYRLDLPPLFGLFFFLLN